MSTEAHLLGAIARLALNYGRHMDQDAMAGTLDTWRTHLGGYEAADVDDAVNRLLADPNLRGMPTVAAVGALCAQSQARRQRAIARPDVHDTVACRRCDDSGWRDAGSDEDGYEYVRPCPEGCQPPLPGSTHRAHRRRRKAPTHQGALADALPDGVSEAVHRMQGERPHPHDEQF